MSGRRTFRSLSCLGRASLGFAVFLAFGPDALACSCAGQTFVSRYEVAANVFTAVITDQHVESTGEYPPVLSSFAVTETFKGERPFRMLESIENGSCAINLEVGVEYLFLVTDSGHVGMCSGYHLRAEQAEGEIAAIRSFISVEDEALVEPWHFGSYDYGCRLSTLFEIGQDYPLGVLSFDVSTTGQVTQLDIHVAAENPGPLTLTVDGTTFFGAPRGQIYPYHVILGQEAERVFQEVAISDFLQIHFDRQGHGPDLNVEVSTRNLRQAGTVAKALACSGPL